MSIVALIVGGLISISVIAVVGDVIKSIMARKTLAVPDFELRELKAKIELLESRLDERDASVAKLQDELHFVTRMLEDGRGRPS